MSGSFLVAAALLAALHGAPATRARVLRPLFAREAREHRLPERLLEAVAFRESTFRIAKRGDHGKAWGLFQLHADAIPGRTLTPRELGDVASNVHFGALRLAIARRRCGGPPERWLGNYNGKRTCGPGQYARRVLEVAAR